MALALPAAAVLVDSAAAQAPPAAVQLPRRPRSPPNARPPAEPGHPVPASRRTGSARDTVSYVLLSENRGESKREQVRLNPPRSGTCRHQQVLGIIPEEHGFPRERTAQDQRDALVERRPGRTSPEEIPDQMHIGGGDCLMI